MSPAPLAPLDKADPERARVLKRKVHDRIADVSRHLRALEAAMADFGENFELAEFEAAHASDEPHLLNKAKAVERGVDQLYNFLAELVRFGLELAGVKGRDERPNARRDLDSLRSLKVLSAERTARLQRLRELRRLLVHEYATATAEQIHQSAWIIHDHLPAFYRAYGEWIKRGFADLT